MIDVYDNVLDLHEFKSLNESLQTVPWHWSSYSNKNFPTKHWVARCGSSDEELTRKGYGWILPVWYRVFEDNNFKEKYGISHYSRIYMNGHTFGMQPHWHKDDGDFTMIYYPNINWKLEWCGGTFIYDEEEDLTRPPEEGSWHGHLPKAVDRYIEYIPNRLVAFSAHKWHQADAVNRECYDLRSIIVFKCLSESGGVPERLDFYND